MAFSTSKMTEKAQEAIVAAQRMAEERQHTQIEPEHLLYVLVTQESGVVPAVIERLGVQPSAVLAALEPALAGMARASGPTQVQLSSRLRRVLDTAASEAERLKDEYVSTEHFLLALADDQRGAAGQVLRDLGITKDRLYEGLQAVRGASASRPPPPRPPTRRSSSTAGT